MLTVGVDLAAEPAGTAIASIEWSPGSGLVRDLQPTAADDTIVAAVGLADKAGIDCPLGWPTDFVEFVTAHHCGHVVAPADVAGRAWRRRLAYRTTDQVVAATLGLWPLSVSADLIGHTAMRAAWLLARLADEAADEGRPVDRSGAGVVVEVYPAAALKLWGLPHRGYKRRENRARLGELVDRLQAEAPWLDLGDHEQTCRESDHAFDAVVAALIARAAAVGQTARPDAAQLEAARTEGWIALPTGDLAGLAAG